MTHLAACILALSVLRIAPSGPVYSRQMRSEGAEERAVWLASSIRRASEVYGVDALLLTSLLWHESAFDRERESSVGCVSIAQLCGRKKAAYDRVCTALRSAYACDGVAVMLAAEELRKGLAVCGSEAGAVSWYRAGRCGLSDSWRVRQVLALAAELEWGST